VIGADSMQKTQVRFAGKAKTDLKNIASYIRNHSDKQCAYDYVKRIREFCCNLEAFPHLGTSQSDLLPGLRILGFEGRISIAFTIDENQAIILRIFYGDQDFDRSFESES
jgi:toxin ParE1/3/4